MEIQLKEYYNQFTSEELELLDEKNKEFNVYHGMLSAYKIVTTLLGEYHPVAKALKENCDLQLHKLSLITFTKELEKKLLK